jgi:hypothetical protein
LVSARISKAYPLFQAEPHPPMYRDARANGFLNYPHFGNGHRTDAPKANGVLKKSGHSCAWYGAQSSVFFFLKTYYIQYSI